MVELKKGVYWVGVTDWDIREFHGHELSTHRGSSYNAYLVVDEKIALIDTVWLPFKDIFLKRLSEIIDIAKIDYVVASHSESDHSSSLPAIMELAPQATVIVSQNGRESFYRHYYKDWNFQVVNTGDQVSLGSKELVFVEAKMLHWPDTLFSYLTKDNILFSNDAFGQHLATSELFNDRVDQAEIMQEAVKYYANILTPFSRMVGKKIEEIKGMNLPLDMVAPSHGVIWRENPMQIIEKYEEWAKGVNEPRAVILFDTMWQGTEKMAHAIAEGLDQVGVSYKIFNLAKSDRNDVITEVFKARGILVGSPTFNNGILPTAAPVLEDLRGLKFTNKIGAAFGSYGWSGESVKLLEERLENAKIKIVQEGLRFKYQPSAEDRAQCVDFGKRFGQLIMDEA